MDGATARHDAVAWGYAKEAAKRGVEIHQLTEVQDFVTQRQSGDSGEDQSRQHVNAVVWCRRLQVLQVY